jgi:hypothetical protein
MSEIRDDFHTRLNTEEIAFILANMYRTKKGTWHGYGQTIKAFELKFAKKLNRKRIWEICKTFPEGIAHYVEVIQNTKREIDIRKCYFCGENAKEVLDEHHLKDGSTIVLCANCHRKIHFKILKFLPH